MVTDTAEENVVEEWNLKPVVFCAPKCYWAQNELFALKSNNKMCTLLEYSFSFAPLSIVGQL